MVPMQFSGARRLMDTYDHFDDGTSKELNSLHTTVVIFFALWIILVAASFTALYLLPGRVFAYLFFAAIPCFFVWRSATKKRRAFIGDKITRVALQRHFELLEFDHNRHIDMALLSELPTSDWNGIKKGSDYIHGRYKGAEFLFSNFVLTDADMDGSTKVRAFNGQWLILKLKHDIWPCMVIDEYHPFTVRRLRDIDFLSENMTFNKRFRIQAEDPQMALHILTPRFIENLLSMDQSVNGVVSGKKLIYIQGGNLHFVLSSKRSFFETMDMSVLQTRIEQDIVGIQCILDVFLSNERLYNT